MTPEMPVGVARTTGTPSSIASESCLREALRRTPLSKPGIVRRVEQERRPMRLIERLSGEDDFVADLQAQRAEPRRIEGARTGAAAEIAIARHELR